MTDEPLKDPLTPKEIAAFRAEFAAGARVVDLAEKYDTSTGTIYRHTKDIDRPRPAMPGRARYMLTEEQTADLIRSYPTKEAVASIGRRLGIPDAVVTRIAGEHGLRRRPRPKS